MQINKLARQAHQSLCCPPRIISSPTLPLWWDQHCTLGYIFRYNQQATFSLFHFSINQMELGNCGDLLAYSARDPGSELHCPLEDWGWMRLQSESGARRQRNVARGGPEPSPKHHPTSGPFPISQSSYCWRFLSIFTDFAPFNFSPCWSQPKGAHFPLPKKCKWQWCDSSFCSLVFFFPLPTANGGGAGTGGPPTPFAILTERWDSFHTLMVVPIQFSQCWSMSVE